MLGMLSGTEGEEDCQVVPDEGYQGTEGKPGGQGPSPHHSGRTNNVQLLPEDNSSGSGLQQSKGAPPPADIEEKGREKGRVSCKGQAWISLNS